MTGLDEFFVAGMAALLASLRAITAFAMTPVLSAYGVPLVLRIFLAMVVGAAAAASIDTGSWGKLLLEPVAFFSLAFGEFLWGVLLGVGAHAAIAAFAIAGRLVDMQSGLSIGAAFDPVTRSQTGTISQIMTATAVMLFFASDAHIALIELLASSYRLFPVGSLPSHDSLLTLAVACGKMFVIGFALVAPVTLALLMTELAIGVVSRNMPQINVMIVAIPLKLWIAMAMLIMVAHTWSRVVIDIVSNAVVLGG